MKKKIFLVISMLLFITNVKALSFNVNLHNIEDKGSDTIGTIRKIDLPNKTLDVFFQDIGDEVNFGLTITNSGDKAGTLREIEFVSGNDKIEYTSNLPEGGLSINENETNEIIIKAKVLEGATNGKTSSQIKIVYKYDEGSCPEGEILSSDESMCLCPEGLLRNDKGVCVKPEKTITCEDDEVYNETKKICEKKASKEDIPLTPDTPNSGGKITPSNPKTLDNIILITLLFVVSGLGIYAVMFKKLNTNKKKVAVGVITGVITLGASFTVLAGVFGLDNLLSAIVNPITKRKEIVLTVNEEIELIETWDGNCNLTADSLTPDNIFEGGSGTEDDPYQIKTAEQLSCLAKSVNSGETYLGKYIKQTKNIKLNDHLISNVDANNKTDLRAWTPIGYSYTDKSVDPEETTVRSFDGNYDGDNHKISGLYITDDSYGDYKALFGYSRTTKMKNIILSDVYLENTSGNSAALLGGGTTLGYQESDIVIKNVKTYGKSVSDGNTSAGIVANFETTTVGALDIENVENNINFSGNASYVGGIVAFASDSANTSKKNIIIKNATNKGTIPQNEFVGGIIGMVPVPMTIIELENVVNTGDFINNYSQTHSYMGGLVGFMYSKDLSVKNSYNTGNFDLHPRNGGGPIGGLVGQIQIFNEVSIDNCFNSGIFNYNPKIMTDDGEKTITVNYNGMTYDEIFDTDYDSYLIGGFIGINGGKMNITNSYNTGSITGLTSLAGGLVANDYGDYLNITNCYNTGNITATNSIGGLVGTGGLNITNSYNTGDITLFGGTGNVGGLVAGRSRNSANVSNSYNTGNISIVSKVDSVQAGGLCGYCRSIKNSYNRGNLSSKYTSKTLSGIYASYIDTGVTNVYNSGNITFENSEGSPEYEYTVEASGISTTSGYTTNAYNLGNLTVNRNQTNFTDVSIVGINLYGSQVDNCVNAGDLTVNVNKPYTTEAFITVSGISYYEYVSNSFNAGTLKIDDSNSSVKLADDGYSHKLDIGEIAQRYGGHLTYNNKFNSNPNGHAVGSYPRDNVLSESQEVGTYTEEATPNILDIINADSNDEDNLPDNAFEILEGETLPTLKVFNQ